MCTERGALKSHSNQQVGCSSWGARGTRVPNSSPGRHMSRALEWNLVPAMSQPRLTVCLVRLSSPSATGGRHRGVLEVPECGQRVRSTPCVRGGEGREGEGRVDGKRRKQRGVQLELAETNKSHVANVLSF